MKMSSFINNLPVSPNEFLLGAMGAAFVTYYLVEVVKRPTLVCRSGPFKTFLENNIKALNKKFWPTFWCFESRLQTVIASIVRMKTLPDINYRRQILKLSDGGEVALDWMEEGCTPTSPIMLILPGLTGASQAEYIKVIMNGGKTIGLRCVVFNNRGLGGIRLKTPRLYCATNHDDLNEVIENISSAYPEALIYATGVSFGGIVLGTYLAARGKDTVLKAVLIISSPLNIFKASDNIEKPILNSYLNRLLAESLCKTIEDYDFMQSADKWNFEEIMKSKTIKEFDIAFTVKHFGFKSVNEYYTDASLDTKLHLIKVPILCLFAADDPFQPMEAIPVKEANESEYVSMLITSRGGHIGFMEGFWPWNGENEFMSQVFTQYFEGFLKNTPVFEDIDD